MVDIGEDRIKDATYHSQSLFVTTFLKKQENFMKWEEKFVRVEDVILNEVFCVDSPIQDVGKVILSRHIQRVSAADVQIILADLFANQSPNYSCMYIPKEVACLVTLEWYG